MLGDLAANGVEVYGGCTICGSGPVLSVLTSDFYLSWLRTLAPEQGGEEEREKLGTRMKAMAGIQLREFLCQ